jgi:hypothetical protein
MADSSRSARLEGANGSIFESRFGFTRQHASFIDHLQLA